MGRKATAHTGDATEAPKPPHFSAAELSSDPLLKYMVDHELPLTREMYLSLNWVPGEIPDPMPAELEAEMPEAFQLQNQPQDQPSPKRKARSRR